MWGEEVSLKEILVQFGSWAVFSSRKRILRRVAASRVPAAASRRHNVQVATEDVDGTEEALGRETAEVVVE